MDARFEAYSASHLVVVAIFLLGIPLMVVWGRTHRGTDREARARRGFAVALGAAGVAMQAYQLTPDDFAVTTSLPIQLCDLATIAAVLALFTRSPLAAAFTYYVGLTLTLQGILTPSLAEGFWHPRFFGFWALHLGVVWAAVYLTWGLGVRPTWRRYAQCVGITLAWAAAAMTFNALTGTNYGYLNRKPSAASALDLLGPWPWYVVAEVTIVAAVWALITWPWTRSADDRSPPASRIAADRAGPV